MEKQLFDKHNKEMLTKGRLNEDFVEKFSNLTIAEMTPAEFKAYQEYVKFLILKAKPEDMNKVLKHAYRSTINEVMELKDSAYELALTMDVATKVYCMTSTEPVDSSILERCTIMKIALGKEHIYEIGGIFFKDGHYMYEYRQNRRADHNYAKPIDIKNSYITTRVPLKPTLASGKLNEAKIEYLKNLMRNDGGDYAVVICKAAVEIGVSIACPEIPLGVQAAYGLADLGIEIVDMPSKNEDFGIKSGDTGTMADLLKVRASVAIPGQKSDLLLYDIYPTNETKVRMEFYNNIFKHYKIEPINMVDVYNHPEDVDKKFDDLETKIGAMPYVYNDEDKCKDFDGLEDLYKKYNSGEIK
jgi:hypothetical protein